ncbi:MAG TPA: ABC transporter ATP-binding protein [Trueperaceae bacterium]|nr:ABC transporter ATP-binding protein [Trueperaceae bacterium]
MARVVFDSVSKHFGSVKAVDEVSFDIGDGEFICLLGPSGCGKTTTLRLLAGLEQPTGGHISIGDREVTQAKPKERDVGMVFQDYALFPHMTIAENIAYPLKVRGVGLHDRNARAEEVARNLGIEQLLARRPGQISGGQQQRTSVARAVVHKPQVFLFDEPLSNLDAKLRIEARSFLKHLQTELGVTAVYVTHDQAEAMALADRIAVMESGRVVQMGKPLEVYRNPATTFVANFLGNPPMNLLPVGLELPAGGAVLRHDAFHMDVPAWRERLTERFRDGASLTLGIRPEHLRLAPADAAATLTGEVYTLEPLGPETLITCMIDGRLITARVFGDEPPALGKVAHFQVDPAHLDLFDDAGNRIAL